MRAALTDALGGSGRLVLLGGEPGIGKTRLASVLADDAESRGVPVWWGRSWEGGSAPAFWSWNTALRGWIDRAGSELVMAAAGSWIAELAHVFPVLRDPGAGLPPRDRADSDRARFRLFDIVSRFVAATAAPAGLVVVLDDVHWADRPSLKLLEFIAADVRDSRLLVVATYRDTEVEREDPFCGTVARLAREPCTRRILVAGLSAAHCARWVALTGTHADVEALGEALHRETNGNPFFLGEIIRWLASEGRLGRDAVVNHVPRGVGEVISRRLDRLGGDCRAMLAVAALFGDVIDATILREILDDRRVCDQLARAVRDRILVELSGGRARYAFAHALIRRLLVDDLEPSARAAWHTRIATVLERHAATSDVAVTELVRHFAAAETPEALRKAFDHACRGAEQAARGLGWEEAVRLYEIALDVGARCGSLDGERAIDLQLALARALRGAGDVPAARARCQAVMAACRRVPRAAFLARAALIHVGPMPEFGRVDPSARAALEEACRGADIDDGLRARLYARLAGDLIAANEVEQAARVHTLCDQATRAARSAGDSGALAMALMGRYYALALRMRPPEGEAPHDTERMPNPLEIIAVAEAAGEHEVAAAMRHIHAVALLASGEADAFSAAVDGLATAAAASRVPQALWLADALAALRATVEGRFAEARQLMDRALATGGRMHLPNAVGLHEAQRIMLCAVEGRLGEIAPEIDAFVDEHPGGAGWRPMRAIGHLARGDVVKARAEFQTLLAAGLDRAGSGVMSRCYLAGVALLCVALRDREHAPMLYERVARQKEAWIVDGCQTLGPWSLVLGVLARLCGRPADAVRHLEAAIALARQMQSRPFVAQAQTFLAGVLLSMDAGLEQRDRIAEIVADAEQSARELGLAHVAARVERLKAKLAGRAGAGSNTFRCEGDVWTVSYRGRDVRLKDGKGPRYLATLLSAPGCDFHVFQLAGVATQTARLGVADALSVRTLGGSCDDAPDARARREYRDRLDDLRAELDDADRCCDQGRSQRLRSEIDLLVSQLTRRFTVHAHSRGPADTARKAVTKVLRTQIGKLLDEHPLLGEHLRASVRMGTVCVYRPRTPTNWDVAFGPVVRHPSPLRTR